MKTSDTTILRGAYEVKKGSNRKLSNNDIDGLSNIFLLLLLRDEPEALSVTHNDEDSHRERFPMMMPEESVKLMIEQSREREPGRYLVFGKSPANPKSRTTKKSKMVRKDVRMRIRPWCHICQQGHVECSVENDEWEFIETPSIINSELETLNGVEVVWEHNNLLSKVRLLNKDIIAIICRVPGRHYYRIRAPTFPGVLYHDLLCAFSMEEKDILCGRTLLRKAICRVERALDQELSSLETFGQSIFDFDLKKGCGHLYWTEKLYRAFKGRCSAHYEDGIILPPHESCSPATCRAHQLVFDGIDPLSDGFRLRFIYGGPAHHISKRISLLASFKEIPHLDRRGLHIIKESSALS